LSVRLDVDNCLTSLHGIQLNQLLELSNSHFGNLVNLDYLTDALEFVRDIGISISSGQLSNLLIQEHESFHTQKQQVYQAYSPVVLGNTTTATGAGVGGENFTCNIICNPLYSVYCTTEKKDRLTVLGVLQGSGECSFGLNQLTLKLLETFNLPQKVVSTMRQLPQDTLVSQAQFWELLHTHLPQLGSQQQTRVLEAAAIAAYHSSQTDWPVVQALVCDDAPQFKWLTEELSLCWVHEGRHYKKLNPSIAYHRQVLEVFLTEFWNYYRQLLAYKERPTSQAAPELRRLFHQLLTTPTDYWELEKRKYLTREKESELLLVLEHPELSLHNNPDVLGARTMVQRRLHQLRHSDSNGNPGMGHVSLSRGDYPQVRCQPHRICASHYTNRSNRTTGTDDSGQSRY